MASRRSQRFDKRSALGAYILVKGCNSVTADQLATTWHDLSCTWHQRHVRAMVVIPKKNPPEDIMFGRASLRRRRGYVPNLKVPQLYNLKGLSNFLVTEVDSSSVEAVIRYKNNAVAENSSVDQKYLAIFQAAPSDREGNQSPDNICRGCLVWPSPSPIWTRTCTFRFCFPNADKMR